MYDTLLYILGALSQSNNNYRFGTARNGTIWIDSVNCVGTETSLTNCDYSFTISHTCTYLKLAGVICQGMHGNIYMYILHKSKLLKCLILIRSKNTATL